MTEVEFPQDATPEDIWELLHDAEVELNKSHVYANSALLVRIRNMREDYEKFLNSTVEQNQLELPLDTDE